MNKLSRRAATITFATAILGCGLRAKAAEPAGPPLWIASRGERKTFLFGQMPVKADTHWLTPKIAAAFDASAELWTENPDIDPAAAKAYFDKTIANGGPTLAQTLPPDQLARLHALLQAAGQPPSSMDAALAPLAYSQLSGLADARSGADFSNLPERVLKARAKAAGMPVRSEWTSFEQVADQMNGANTQRELIEKSLDDVDAASSNDARIAAWLRGDVSAFEAEMRRDRRLYPELAAQLSGRRNKAWVPRLLEAMARSKRVFVCVGLLHLIGPESIQAYLAAAGLKVTRT